MKELQGNYGSVSVEDLAITEICQSGDNTNAVHEWLAHPATQFHYSRDQMIKELSEYGAWEDLNDVGGEILKERLLWTLAWNEFENDTE